MDAQYLNKNVNGALKEALTSLAVLGPDDPVEFLVSSPPLDDRVPFTLTLTLTLTPPSSRANIY